MNPKHISRTRISRFWNSSSTMVLALSRNNMITAKRLTLAVVEIPDRWAVAGLAVGSRRRNRPVSSPLRQNALVAGGQTTGVGL